MDTNRTELLQQKAQIIEQELSKWIDEQNILASGERINVRIEIERAPTVISTVALPESDLTLSIHELDLSVRAENCMNNANISILGQLCQKTVAEMLKYRNFGKKSLTEVLLKLNKRGLTLAGEIPADLLAPSLHQKGETVSEREWQQVEIRELKESDWKKMLKCLRFRSYLKETIVMLKESKNKALFAAQILRNVRRSDEGETEEHESPGTSMTSLYRINQQFRLQGLPYRLKPTWVPRHRHHIGERKLQIGFLKEAKKAEKT